MKWGTVTMADEPSELLLAFAAWHAHLGASEIHIFLDKPNKPLAAALRAIPGVIVTICDEMFWAANGKRALNQTKRQDVIANIAYEEAGVDWLAHIDADEFILDAHGMEAEIAALPHGIVGLRLPVRERVWTGPPEGIFDGVFKVPIAGRLGLDRPILGPLAAFTQRGLTGHSIGKTMVRTGRGLTLSIHAPKDPEKLHMIKSRTTRLLHFDGLTPFHWLLKRLKYASLPHAQTKTDADSYRWRQILTLKEMESVADAEAFRDRLTVIAPELEAQLRAMQLVEDAPRFDIAAALGAYGLEDTVLTARRFDRRLRKKHADFIEAIGYDT